ncbi:MAG: aminotransferase class V-fold PLP-dependent enzyme [Paraclostridium sp.]
MSLPLRNCIIGVDTPILTTKGYIPRVFFNNSATNLVVKPVKNMLEYLLPIYTYIDIPNANSDKITAMYNNVRNIVLNYVGGDLSKDTVVYTKNATDAINMLSNAFRQESPDKVVLTTKMEHMANYLPYKENMNTVLINLTPEGLIDMADYRLKLEEYKGRVKLVAVTGASNVTGVVPDFYEMARLAHEYGAMIIVDIVQLLQHRPFTMKPHSDPEHIDFVAFSAHKCYTGLDGGALVGNADFLNKYFPIEFGAGITKYIDDEKVIYSNMPTKYETGYPDILGIISMGEALKFLSCVGLDNIANYEKKLYEYLIYKLKEVPGIKIYVENSPQVKIPYVAFNIDSIYFKTVASKLGYDYGIEVTSGVVGSNMYVQFLLGISNEEAYALYESGKGYGVVRVTLAFYNTFYEIDRLAYALKEIVKSNNLIV